jgi:hypothetical protein
MMALLARMRALDPLASSPGPLGQVTTPETPEEQAIANLLPGGQPVPTTPRPSDRMLRCANTPPPATSPSPPSESELSEQLMSTPSPASSPEWTTHNSGVLNRFGEECFFDSSLQYWTYTEREKQRLQDDLGITGYTGVTRLERRLERAILFGSGSGQTQSSPHSSTLSPWSPTILSESQEADYDECNGDLDDDDDDANDSEDGDLDDDDDDSTMSMVSMISLDGLSFISSNESPNWLDDIDQSELPTYEDAWSI